MARWLIWFGLFVACMVLGPMVSSNRDAALLIGVFMMFWSVVTPIAAVIAVIRWLVKGRTAAA